MKTLAKMTLLAALTVASLTVSAQVFNFTLDSGTDPNNPANAIPDGDSNGLSDTRIISGAGPFPLGFFTKVKLDIEGYTYFGIPVNPINGDYYATLTHVSSGLKAVLLNRVGFPESPNGYGDAGFNVTLQDFVTPASSTAANDIHTYQNVLGHVFQSPLTGVWAPDGRSADPSKVTMNRADAINQPLKMLSVFSNAHIDPNGQWTLFVADLSQGGQGKLVSWGLEFVAVPEPREYALIAGLALVGFALYRRYGLKAA